MNTITYNNINNCCWFMTCFILTITMACVQENYNNNNNLNHFYYENNKIELSMSPPSININEKKYYINNHNSKLESLISIKIMTYDKLNMNKTVNKIQLNHTNQRKPYDIKRKQNLHLTNATDNYIKLKTHNKLKQIDMKFRKKRESLMKKSKNISTTLLPLPVENTTISMTMTNFEIIKHEKNHRKNLNNFSNFNTIKSSNRGKKSIETTSTTEISSNFKENNNSTDDYNLTLPICFHEVEKDQIPCRISENETCFGDPEYCNYTYEQYIAAIKLYMFPTTSEWILICSHAVVFIMGLVGNALVCIAVYTNYSMRTVTNVFIVNLAVADFFVILVCLPPSVLWDVTETWFMGEIMCKVAGYIQLVSVTVSVLTLTFISIDRWYAICFPLRYRTKISRAIVSVALIWIFAFVSSVPELLALTISYPKLRFGLKLFAQCVTTWDKKTEENVMIARFMLLYTLPLLLMTVAYFKIVRVLWKSDTIPGHRESRNHYQFACGYSRSSCMPPANSSTMGQLRARRKAAKMLVAVVVMFAICYFPVHMFSILRFEAGIQDEVKAVLVLFSHWLCYANSAVNPVIYNFMSGKFRREFHHALDKCRCSRIPVEDRILNHSTPAPSRLNTCNLHSSVRSNYQLASLREVTRDTSRQTLQTTFADNSIHRNSINNHQKNHNVTSSTTAKIP